MQNINVVHFQARQCNTNNNCRMFPHRPRQLHDNLYVALIKHRCCQQFANGGFKENESKQKKTYLLLWVYRYCQDNRYLSKSTLIFSTHCMRASVFGKKIKSSFKPRPYLSLCGSCSTALYSSSASPSPAPPSQRWERRSRSHLR